MDEEEFERYFAKLRKDAKCWADLQESEEKIIDNSKNGNRNGKPPRDSAE